MTRNGAGSAGLDLDLDLGFDLGRNGLAVGSLSHARAFPPRHRTRPWRIDREQSNFVMPQTRGKHRPDQLHTKSAAKASQAATASDRPPSFSAWAHAAEEIAGGTRGPIGSLARRPAPAAAGIVTVVPGQACDLAAIDPT